MQTLHDLAHCRAGDKGTTSDLTLIAYHTEDYPRPLEHVTPARVHAHFPEINHGEILRYELPHPNTPKFVLHNTLGGVTRTPDPDIHGKSLSSLLPEMHIPDPDPTTPAHPEQRQEQT
jgi:hypothetical protein